MLAPSTMQTMPPVVEHVRQMMVGASSDGIVHALRAMASRPDSSAMLKDITVPTLAIGGREDAIVSVGEVRATADAIPDAHCTIVPDAGHLTPLEQPVNTGRLIKEFLESLA